MKIKKTQAEVDQEKLVRLQDYLASAVNADVSAVRRAFNNANDAEYYARRFEYTAGSIGTAALFGVCTGVGGIIGIVNSSMPAAVCLSLATFGMYAWAKAAGRGQKAVREEIIQKVAAVPKAPEL